MVETYIKYIDHSIGSAFKDLYIVPDYQREYVWEEEQGEQLLEDLLDAYNNDNKMYSTELPALLLPMWVPPTSPMQLFPAAWSGM